ncbi:class I SAM-dependent methyltransferase [Candidatus Woesearchaeota archaeon]|nr:class I SAM-dependent methyltransferase [Nanoarchaeota archaeon]MCB9370639.1 class I SAM-dependent methyltransferase [Candidatus Woesearchaeota archaeon]USN43723.1 MAG: class I SAM-dependent methyltransferase [Candidatus Woesearchaeota archaeon]
MEIEKALCKLSSEKDGGAKYWNISWNQGLILSEFVSLKQPKCILEIGTSNGFSTLWLAKNLSADAKITTVEVDPHRAKLAQKTFDSLEPQKNILLLHAEAREALETMKIDKKFDCVFLDACQKFYQDLLEIMLRRELLAPRALIMADNVLSHKLESFVTFMQGIASVQIISEDSGLLVAVLHK